MTELFSKEETCYFESKMTNAVILALGLCAAPQIASAQTMQWTDKGYVTFNVGVQVGSARPRYKLELSACTTRPPPSAPPRRSQAAAFFEIGGAYRVWGNNLLAGVSFTRTKSDADVAITASIPDPVVLRPAPHRQLRRRVMPNTPRTPSTSTPSG